MDQVPALPRDKIKAPIIAVATTPMTRIAFMQFDFSGSSRIALICPCGSTIDLTIQSKLVLTAPNIFQAIVLATLKHALILLTIRFIA